MTHADVSPEAQARLLSLWRREEQQPFRGWDFSYLSGRMSDDEPPWSYTPRATELLRGASSVVDLGTGGGERLMEVRDAWPARVTATEEHPPNFQLASDRLSPLGVRVASVRLTEIDPLPFDHAEFDIVLNRHSAFNCTEVARVLAPGGTFLTQQVHGRSAEELQAAFGVEPLWPDASPDRYVPRLAEAGLDMVTVQTWTGHVTFTDVGALVYYLHAVPWFVPNFSVATHQARLLRLQQRLDAGEAALTFPTRLYLIEAKRGLDKRADARRIVAEGYDRIAETYAAWSRRVVDEVRPRYTSVLVEGLPPGARLLELGCGGGGPSTRELAERFALTGVDISATQVEMARHNVPTATFLQQDMLTLDFAADSFDGVAAFYTLTHLPYGELPGFLRKMGGWVRAGGLLVATLSSRPNWGQVEPDWLGAPMYFSGYSVEDNQRFVEAKVSAWEAAREDIRAAILSRGWDESVKAFTGAFDSDHLDVGVLLLPMVGFLPGDDERVVATLDAIERDLSRGGLVQRWSRAGDLACGGRQQLAFCRDGARHQADRQRYQADTRHG